MFRREEFDMAQVDRIEIDNDPDPDLSWLDQDCYKSGTKDFEHTYRTSTDSEPIDPYWYRDKRNHVTLMMVAYDEDNNVVDSLGGIDFLIDSDEYKFGTIRRLSQLDGFNYLRELAQEMGMV